MTTEPNPSLIVSIDEPSPPGDTLQEILECKGMTQLELADRIGLDKKTINLIINGIATISQDTALGLELVLGVKAHFWLNLETRYQESLARKNEDQRMMDFVKWAKLFPYSQMANSGWVPPTRNAVDKVRNLLKYFAVSSPQGWNDTYYGRTLETSYRRSPKVKDKLVIVSSWLRKGELAVEDAKDIPPFDSKAFEEAVEEIRSFTLLPDVDAASKRIKELCFQCGVIYTLVPELPSLGISGVMRWVKNRPLIQQSLRFKSNDQFWFTFFHEAFHVFQNQKKRIFLDGTDVNQEDLDRENEANSKAGELLIPNHAYLDFLSTTDHVNTSSIRVFANSIGIHPGIVVGRLQRDGKLSWSHPASSLKIKLEWASDE